MSSDAAMFIGNIPEHYDTGLGPMIFLDYAAYIARRAAACNHARTRNSRRHRDRDTAITRFSASRRACDSY
jgi:hypothetical protein